MGELRFCFTGLSSMHRCCAFPFALAGLFLFSILFRQEPVPDGRTDRQTSRQARRRRHRLASYSAELQHDLLSALESCATAVIDCPCGETADSRRNAATDAVPDNKSRYIACRSPSNWHADGQNL